GSNEREETVTRNRLLRPYVPAAVEMIPDIGVTREDRQPDKPVHRQGAEESNADIGAHFRDHKQRGRFRHCLSTLYPPQMPKVPPPCFWQACICRFHLVS